MNEEKFEAQKVLTFIARGVMTIFNVELLGSPKPLFI